MDIQYSSENKWLKIQYENKLMVSVAYGEEQT